jgi:uncharacterized membrane protein
MHISDNAGPRRAPIQSRRRAVVKTALYRVLMLAVTVAVTFAVTGDGSVAVSVGVGANVVKTLAYYCYERAWDRVQWGLA